MYPSSYGEKWESSEEKSSKKKNRDKKDSEKRRKTSLVDKNFEVLMGKADFQEQRASLPPAAFKPDEATQFLEERKALREKEKKKKREAKKRSKKAETADHVLEPVKKETEEPAAAVRSRISASEGNLRVLSGTAKFTEEHAEGNYEVITAIREQERKRLKQKKKRESALKRRKAMWKKIIKRVTYATILAALVAVVVYVLYLAVDN